MPDLRAVQEGPASVSSNRCRRLSDSGYAARVDGLAAQKNFTCQGGIARPQPIDDVMASVLEEEGVDAAIERYRKLRITYVGARAYDFSFRPLNRLAERLGRARVVDVIRFLELNAEFNPTSLPTLILLGGSYEANGDDESALGVYQGVLELDADLQFYDFYAGQARDRIAAIGGE